MIDKLDLESMDIAKDKQDKLKAMFPEVFSEGKIDFERLRATLGDVVDESNERYEMNWAGKKNCFRAIQEPSRGTLKPIKDDSIDFDTTENLYIEGDNLEVLKLLQKSYFEKVKMIYIDPPYNTGKDFVYPDDYKDNLQNYLQLTGQVDSEGKKIKTNVDTDGRYHSNWMNMMYPRLFLARNLLREDGVIFISIDDNEVTNLRKICDEIFGEENSLGVIIQNKQNAKNDTLNIQRNHEYVLVYRKNAIFNGTEIMPTITNKVEKILEVFKEDEKFYYINDAITTRGEGGTLNARPNLGYTVYYNETTKEKIAIADYNIELARTSNDEGAIYSLKNDMLEKGFVPIRSPKVRGQLGCWTWSLEKFNQNNNEIIITGKNGSYAVKKRTFVNPSLIKLKDGKFFFTSNVLANSRSILDFSTNDGTNVLNSVMKDESVFSNPKNLKMIEYFVNLLPSQDDIILDFFSGSATTAHAVMDLNAQDGGNRKFIMVQLPEPTDESSEAFKAGYKNICEIGKERIRRAGKKIKEQLTVDSGQLKLGEEEKINKNIDTGFRVFRLDKSNFNIWQGENVENLQQALFNHIEHIDKNSSTEDILFELILKAGYEINTPVIELVLEGKKVYSLMDGGVLISLEKNLTKEFIKAIAEMEPIKVILLDEGFNNNDALKTNAVEIMKSKNIDDFRTV